MSKIYYAQEDEDYYEDDGTGDYYEKPSGDVTGKPGCYFTALIILILMAGAVALADNDGMSCYTAGGHRICTGY